MDQMSTFLMIAMVVFGIIVLVTVLKTLYTVRTATCGGGGAVWEVQPDCAGRGCMCWCRLRSGCLLWTCR